MAEKAFVLAELETVLRGVVAGNRSFRLDAMNAFRATEVKYLVNAQTAGRDEYDTAVTDFTTAVSNAAAGSVTADTEDLEVIFRYLLTAGRDDRLAVLNVVRPELTPAKSVVEYLVNVDVPTAGEAAAALTAVAADADA